MTSEIKLFPTLALPEPIDLPVGSDKKPLKNLSKYKVGVFNTQDSVRNSDLPGILKVSKPSIDPSVGTKTTSNRTVIGFTTSSLRLDASDPQDKFTRISLPSEAPNVQQPAGLAITNIDQVSLDSRDHTAHTGKSTTKKRDHKPKADTNGADVMVELRNYTSMMDSFSVHNFMIWNGRAMKSTPEFQSYRRTYNNEWGGISHIIRLLEEIMTAHDIKLAIINGYKIYELAILNMPFYDRNDLLACVDNIDQIRSSLNSLRDASKLNQQIRAAICLQKIIRRWKAQRAYREFMTKHLAATKIQSRARLYIHIRRAAERMRMRIDVLTESWRAQRKILDARWQSRMSKDSISSNKTRLIIHIPSIPASEFNRLSFDHVQLIENSVISCLYELTNPNVVVAYILPIAFGPAEEAYVFRYLAGLGIKGASNRLHFIVPELMTKFPAHMNLSQALWYSSGALRRLRRMIRAHSDCVLIPSSVTWIEKRLCTYLAIPMLTIDPAIAEVLSSRSAVKRLFIDSNVNVPNGTYDVTTEEDFIISISRLVAANLDVNRWRVKLNYDLNNDSYAVLPIHKFAILKALRQEMQHVTIMNGNNPSAWYSRPVQISARRKVISALNAELSSKIKIFRTDKYPSWNIYLKFMKQVGCVIEAEPPQVLGHVKGLCFIEPGGKVNIAPSGGIDVIENERFQEVGYNFPQYFTSAKALQNATQSVAITLYKKYAAIGHIAITFISFWDPYDNIPKLWAESISFGMTPIFGALGTYALVNGTDKQMLNPFFPNLSSPHMKHMVFIPLMHHSPLRSSRDDTFFKLCKMYGVVFDMAEGVGTLFPLLDSILSGALCCLCISKSRMKVLELVCDVFNFILQQFGKDHSVNDDMFDWENCTLMFKLMKLALRNEEKAATSDKALEQILSMTGGGTASVGSSSGNGRGNHRRTGILMAPAPQETA